MAVRIVVVTPFQNYVWLLKQLITFFSATSQNCYLIVYTSWMERDTTIDHV